MTKMKNMPKGIGDLLLLITAIVWGGGFIGVSKSLFWKRLVKVKGADLLPGCMIGAFLFLGFVFQTTGALYLSVGKLSFLTALNVIIVPFITFVIFKEKIKKICFKYIYSCYDNKYGFLR